MPTLLHPAPWTPRRPVLPRLRLPGRKPRSGFVPPLTSAEPSPYTRSALPLALAWFVVPAIVLVASFVNR